MFRSVLVPVDGSEPSLRAAGFALELARGALSCGEHPTVVLLTAVAVPQALVLVAGTNEETIDGYVQATGREALAPAKALFAQAAIDVTLRIALGPAFDAILAEVKATSPDVVIMGKRGLGELRGLLLGSVSDRVSRHLQVPVVLVP